MKFEVFKDRAGEHRWRLLANNGKIIASSGEGYKNKGDLLEMLNSIQKWVKDAPIFEQIEQEKPKTEFPKRDWKVEALEQLKKEKSNERREEGV